MIWIGILFVLLLAADYSLLCKKDISFTLPLAGFTLTFLAYILSWTKLFPYFREIINIIILLFSGYAAFVYLRSKDKKHRLNAVLSPGLIGYLVLCVIAVRVSNALFCQWDEFSHWGTVVKDMFYSKRLGIYPDSVSTYQTYPPGAALWELYFASYFREWNDWPVIFAFNLLLIQWMIPLFGCLRSRKEERKGVAPVGKSVLLTIIFVIVVYLVPFLYYSPFEGIPWRCIYADRALAIGFAWILFMHFGTAPEKKDKFYYFVFSAGLGFQCLLKGTGIGFVLMALLMIIPDVFLTAGEEKKRTLVRYGISCIFPLLAILSWYTGLRIMNVSRVWDMNRINIDSILRLISGEDEFWRYDIIRSFPYFLKGITLQFFHGSIILTLTAYPLFWAAGPGLVSALNGRKNRSTDKRNLLIASAALLEFVIYELAVLFTELYVLSQKEGLQLASGQRYSADYILGMSCFILFYVISYLFSETNPGRRNYFYFLLLLLFLFCSVSVEKAVRDLTDTAEEAAASYEHTNFARYHGIEEEIGKLLDPESSCYILSEDDPYGHFVLRKQFIPIRTNRESIDSDTENQCEEFVKEILFNGYDHVFVNKVSEEFSDLCKGIFEDRTISELTLYRVVFQDGFTLEPEASFN
ncbi:MAG: hypothetical protein J5898_10960 [Lachnospiraceae bacterium]|nr:hypothetical protein [Lachnospiraceae bacterium]